MRSESASQRGLTLVEITIVLALIAALAVMASTNFQGMQPRFELDDFSKQLVRSMVVARARAISVQVPVVMVFDTRDGGDGYRVWFFRDSDFNFTLAAFKTTPVVNEPDEPENVLKNALGALLVDPSDNKKGLKLPTGIIFASSLPAAFAAPFAFVPTASGGTCSFCDGAGWGSIIFDTDGTVRFDNGSATPPLGGALSLGSDRIGNTKNILIAGPSGVTRIM